jgi:superfamily II DNA helicase RecQ
MSAQALLKNIRVDLEELEELCQALSKSNAQMSTKTVALEQRNLELEQTNRDQLSKITTLQNNIDMLEDDRRQLTRVSSIVNLEKQNQSFKREIEQLHEKINRLLAAQVAQPTQVTQAVQAVQAEPKPQEYIELEVPLETDLFEKTIQGTSYFVDDDGFVYTKNADATPGKRLGKLSKVGGKLSVVPLLS